MSHQQYATCIDACNECAATCEHCATACINDEHAAKLAACIDLDRYCADMCRLAAAFMARSNEHTMSFVNKFCNLCAEICNACADECEKHTHMEHCQKCAEACRRCAAECTAMQTTV
jgi:hypothetical protein